MIWLQGMESPAQSCHLLLAWSPAAGQASAVTLCGQQDGVGSPHGVFLDEGGGP